MSLFEEPRMIRMWLDRMKGDRITVENTWQDISDFMLGTRDFNTTRTPGDTRTEKIYDGTALESHQLLTGGMHGLFTNPATENFDLEVDDPSVNDDLDAAVWLEHARSTMGKHLRRAQGSFQQQISEYWLDVSGWGMGAISVLDVKGTPVFSAHPLAEIYCEEGEEGKIDVIFREVEMTSRQIADRFKDADELPEEVIKDLQGDKPNPENRHTVVQLVAKSDDPFAGQSPFRKTWTAVFMFCGRKDLILETGGFNELPTMVGRWTVETGETYGRGPGHIALPDAQMLNEMAKTKLKAIQKATDPPLLVMNESVLDGIRTSPGSINIVEYQFGLGGNADPIRPLQNNAQINLTIEEITNRQGLIRRLFFANVLALFDNPNMTAEQVIQLAQRMQQLMAPIMGRQEGEILEPLYDRTFNILLRGGKFLPIPNVLRGREIHVVYRSPLHRAQRVSESRAVLETWQAATLIAEASQSAAPLDNLNPDASVRFVAEANGVPRSVLHTRDRIAETRAGREQAQAEQAQMDQLGQGAEIVNTLGQAMSGLQPPAA